MLKDNILRISSVNSNFPMYFFEFQEMDSDGDIYKVYIAKNEKEFFHTVSNNPNLAIGNLYKVTDSALSIFEGMQIQDGDIVSEQLISVVFDDNKFSFEINKTVSIDLAKIEEKLPSTGEYEEIISIALDEITDELKREIKNSIEMNSIVREFKMGVMSGKIISKRDFLEFILDTL